MWGERCCVRTFLAILVSRWPFTCRSRRACLCCGLAFPSLCPGMVFLQDAETSQGPACVLTRWPCRKPHSALEEAQLQVASRFGGGRVALEAARHVSRCADNDCKEKQAGQHVSSHRWSGHSRARSRSKLTRQCLLPHIQRRMLTPSRVGNKAASAELPPLTCTGHPHQIINACSSFKDILSQQTILICQSQTSCQMHSQTCQLQPCMVHSSCVCQQAQLPLLLLVQRRHKA